MLKQNSKINSMKTIIINGANGYVASNFVLALLKQNYRVVALVRVNQKQSAQERMRQVLSEMCNGCGLSLENLTVCTYSLLEKDFSIEQDKLNEIFKGDVDYFHFAASLKYDEKSKEEIFKTNIDGVENSIQVFLKYASKKSRFFYIGTAYSCGKSSDVFYEKFYDNEPIQAFRNYYELSKRYAENVVRHHINKNNLNGYVIRLSQVVGNHKSGETKTNYGIFDFARRIWSFSQRYPNQVVRIHVDPESSQNLVPVNTIAEYLLETVRHEEVPVIMNFAAKKSVKNGFIIGSLNKLLPVTLIPLKEFPVADMKPTERLVSVGMAFTGLYAETNLVFDTSQRDKIIAYSPGQETDEVHVFEMLKYFIDSQKNRNGENSMQTKSSPERGKIVIK